MDCDRKRKEKEKGSGLMGIGGIGARDLGSGLKIQNKDSKSGKRKAIQFPNSNFQFSIVEPVPHAHRPQGGGQVCG